MKVNLSMDDIRTKVEEYIKKAGRATGRPVLTAYYVMTADTTPDNERTNIMLALVAIDRCSTVGFRCVIDLKK